MNEDFEAQRAVLNAELTAIAVSGGDTSRVRGKLAKLDKREQAAADAVAQAQAAVAEVQKDFVAERALAIAESFVNTFRRDYLSRMDLSETTAVLHQLADAFEHFNEVHPHSALKMKSPRELRRHQALHCE